MQATFIFRMDPILNIDDDENNNNHIFYERIPYPNTHTNMHGSWCTPHIPTALNIFLCSMIKFSWSWLLLFYTVALMPLLSTVDQHRIQPSFVKCAIHFDTLKGPKKPKIKIKSSNNFSLTKLKKGFLTSQTVRKKFEEQKTINFGAKI